MERFHSLVCELGSSSAAVQELVARELANLASNSPSNQQGIAAAGGIPPLVRLLDSSSTAVLEQAARALANLACHSPNQQAIEVQQAGGELGGGPAGGGVSGTLRFALLEGRAQMVRVPTGHTHTLQLGSSTEGGFVSVVCAENSREAFCVDHFVKRGYRLRIGSLSQTFPTPTYMLGALSAAPAPALV